MVIEQDILEDIFRGSAGELFYDLQLQMADVYESKIIPELVAESSSLYGAYELHSPRYVEIGNGNPIPVLRDGDVDKCTKILAFARKPTLTDEEIEAQREAKKKEKLRKNAARQGFKLSAIEPTDNAASGQTAPADKTKSDANESTPPVKRGRGRPPGSKNKKTLELEQQAAGTASSDTGGADESTPPAKRGRGRPPGSKNKKTLEREQQAAGTTSSDTGGADESTPPAKRGRGRPPGSKNKKTLERERLAAEASQM